LSPTTQPAVTIRRATPADSALCGPVCHAAFKAISTAHNFPPDFPNPDATTAILSTLFSLDGFYCVVAEREGRVVGSNVLDERALIHGVGPITVDPTIQNAGVGRRLMEAVIGRAGQQAAAGIRLVQAAFHNRSLSLYTSLGFDVREPLACMQGSTRESRIPGCDVRPAVPADVPACAALSTCIHGFERSRELSMAIEREAARVVERDGRITGYTTGLAYFGHSTAETNPDLQALIASVERFEGPGILLPTRNAALFRWCLANGLRVVQPMTLMSMGLYNDPAGAWLPSITF
jgi:predicted N-acetyltransferase YhbS